jgi:hypothetical protein
MLGRAGLDRAAGGAEDRRLMATLPPITFQALGRSGLVVAGLLLIAVGIGDSVAGHVKISQYQQLLRTTAAPASSDPAGLFPTASEGQERYELARAKLAFYQLLLTAGQLISALGFVLLAVGIVRLHTRPPRSESEEPAPGSVPRSLPPSLPPSLH